MPNNPLYRYLFITYLFIRGIYPLILAEYVFLESFGMNALFSHTRIYRLCLFSATKRLFTGFDLLALPDHLKEEFDIAENEKYLKPLLQRSSAQLKVSPKWNQSVGWKCTHCRGKWWASPSNRMKRHSEFQCPYCREIKPTMKGLQQLTSSSNVFENDTSNSLLRNRFPAIAKQWDHLRNGNHLNKIAVDLRSANSLSCADAWWKCPQCRKSWKESIRSRVLSFEMYSAESTNDYLSLLCPRCLESCGHHVLSGNSGFLSDHKQLLNEANLRPNQKADAISLYSDTLLNWTCSYCSHEYQNSVANRYLRNECCPQCSGRVKTYLNLLVCQRPDVVKEISHNISHAFLQKISVMDDRKLPFICRVCHAVYYMKVRTRCMIPKGQLACPKCFFRSSLSESCIAVETSPQSRRQVKRRLQGHRIRTQKAAEQGRCVESISLAQHILEQKDRSLSN